MKVKKREAFDHLRLSSLCLIDRVKMQSGMAMLAVVAIILSIVTFATLTTTQSVQQFYTHEKVRRDSESSKVSLKQHLKSVAGALRSQSATNALNTTDVDYLSTTIEVSALEGTEGQPLTHFKVKVSHDSDNSAYTTHFLRYPSLLRLPTPSQHLSWDNQVTNWLFNRDISSLSASFFAESESLTQCHNMLPANVYWITGNCILSSNALAHHSGSNPILLVVVNGNLTLQANTHVYGLIVMLSTSHNSFTLKVASSASITGTYVANTPITEQINGAIALSTPLLQTLQASTPLAKIMPIPGTAYDDL